MSPNCPKCQEGHTVKNGRLHGRQRYKCQGCGYQFTRMTPRGRPASEKMLAGLLYQNGFSMSAIARLLGLSTPTVLKWVRQQPELAASRQKTNRNNKIIPLAELCEHLGSSDATAHSGRVLVSIPVQAAIGDMAVVINPTPPA
ncbi:MAG: IS1 family transposase [Magnetococcales bacterium]|nr:IS1 family transposase [Magnetococcales bacterium]